MATAIPTFAANEVVSRGNVNSRITGFNNLFPLSIANGGTNAITEHGIRYNINVMETRVLYDNTNGGTSGDITFNLPSGTSLKDYRYLEFYYSNKAEGIYDDGFHVSKVYRWQQSSSQTITRFNNTIGLTLCGATHSGDNTYFILCTTRYNIETQSGDAYSGKAIKLTNKSFYVSFGDNGCSRHPVDSNNNIWVFRVLGYKI